MRDHTFAVKTWWQFRLSFLHSIWQQIKSGKNIFHGRLKPINAKENQTFQLKWVNVVLMQSSSLPCKVKTAIHFLVTRKQQAGAWLTRAETGTWRLSLLLRMYVMINVTQLVFPTSYNLLQYTTLHCISRQTDIVYFTLIKEYSFLCTGIINDINTNKHAEAAADKTGSWEKYVIRLRRQTEVLWWKFSTRAACVSNSSQNLFFI